MESVMLFLVALLNVAVVILLPPSSIDFLNWFAAAICIGIGIIIVSFCPPIMIAICIGIGIIIGGQNET